MKKEMIIALFSGLALMQIASPISMILKREAVLKNGEQFRFKTAPVDPYDAFRGRYVALSIEGSRVPAPKGEKLNFGQDVYALIAVDGQGFAKLSMITKNRPSSLPYIKAKVRFFYKDEAELSLPFDRYYMEEGAAPAAEKIYWGHSSRDKQDAYVLVRVKDGFAVIEALYVGGERIEEAIKTLNKR